ncbi:MAG: NUDIX domain-containing protein [Chloroflexi bacterium]|nr:NUDIX domain-containing protein [Chloroflexota bacterium]
MKYCPKCGRELTTRPEGGRDRLACPACPYVYFGDFSIGVGGVVIRDGRALLIRRGQEPRRGWWQIPGGYVEHDEEFDRAVVREVFEEAGVHTRVVDVLGLRNSVGAPSTNVYVVFRLEPLSGEPTCDGDEITGAGYFSLDALETMEKVQSLSKWAIRAALVDRPGFRHVAEADLIRPGYVLYGLDGAG